MKKLIADLKRQIKSCKKFDVNPDAASWGYEEGVLLTANEAKSIVEQIEKLEAEKRELQYWKESMMAVTKDLQLQEIGKVLNVKLGTSISENVLPSIKKLINEKAELVQFMKIFMQSVEEEDFIMSNNTDDDIVDNLLSKFNSLIQKHKQ